MTSPPNERSGPRPSAETAPNSLSPDHHGSGTREYQTSTWQRSVPPGAWSRPGRVRTGERLGSAISRLPFFRYGTPEQRRRLVAAVEDERRRCENRKARVLAHRDLARELARALGYVSPEMWNGYVPPAYWGGRQNDSPRRDAIMAVLRAVAEREAAQASGVIVGEVVEAVSA